MLDNKHMAKVADGTSS